jgi:hypothetical protein
MFEQESGTLRGSESRLEQCLERLDRFSCQVAQALALTSPEPTREELLELIGPEAKSFDVDRALDGLRCRGLIDVSGDAIRVHPIVRERRGPAGLGPRATELLRLRTTDQLHAIASNMGIGVCHGGLSRPQLVSHVAIGLTAPERVRCLMRHAPTDVAALAMRLAVGTPTITTSADFSPAYRCGAPERTWRSPHLWLTRHGLVIEQDRHVAAMPREVAMVLRGGRPFATLTAVRPPLFPMAVDPLHVERSAAQKAHRVVRVTEQLIEMWALRPARLLKNGTVGSRDLQRLSSATGLGLVEACFAVELAAHAGLVGVNSGCRSAVHRAACDGWAKLSFERRWESLVRTWLEAPSHLGRTTGDPSALRPDLAPFERSVLPVAKEQRRVCLVALLDADPGTGVDESSLFARVEWEAPLLWNQGPATPATRVGWVCRDAEFLGILCEGSLSGPGRDVARGDLGGAATLLSILSNTYDLSE